MITFNYVNTNRRPAQTKPLKEAIAFLFARERKVVEAIHYIFCNDDFLVEINRTYLQHDYFTDIITFPFSEGQAPVLADIYISLDRVFENSHSLNVAFQNELRRVVFHGALHLCGYDDKNKGQAKLMRKKEDEYLILTRSLFSRGTIK